MEVNSQLLDNIELKSSINRSELRISGRIVSRGKGIGIAVKLEPTDRRLSKEQILKAHGQQEQTRLRAAIEIATGQLSLLIANSPKSNANSAVAILDAQLLILSTSSLVSKINDRIELELINVEWAAKLTADDYFDQFRALTDENLRERSADIQDVFERIYDVLSPDSKTLSFPPNSVIIATEVLPSNILEMAKNQPAAIIVESGGWTSHAFIMARELGIPAISGIRHAVHRIAAGTLVAVDAVAGFVVMNPSEELRADYETEFPFPSNEPIDGSSNGIVNTVDGVEISIAANVDNLESCHNAIEMGAHEIGLVRSEYLFDVTRRLPDEALQTEVYGRLAAVVGNKTIRIRTFDLSVGQLTSVRSEREKNPGLGLRSIRLSLRYERQFRAQLRALIRANAIGNIEIVLPLVSGVTDILRTRAILDDEFYKLNSLDPVTKMPKLGAMIELPSAVLTIDDILSEADFVCMGTNDLVQYLVGVDRDNETVAEWYETLHPSVLSSIKMVVDAADRANRSVTICGEMAGSAFYTPLLVGLGVRRLSVSPVSIINVSNEIRTLDSVVAKDLASSTRRLSTAEEIEAEIFKFNASIRRT